MRGVDQQEAAFGRLSIQPMR